MPLARTAQLEWTVLPADAANKNVTFASDNTEVATVNASGLVTGVAPGTANITVTTVDGGFTDVIAVTVEEAVAVTEIVIAPAAITIPVTTSVTETLVANVIPENATDTTVAWTSEDETIATVSVNGRDQGHCSRYRHHQRDQRKRCYRHLRSYCCCSRGFPRS